MLTIIGVLLILLGIAAIALRKYEGDRNADIAEAIRTSRPAPKPFHNPLTLKPTWPILAGVLVIMLNGFFFWAEAGTAYAVQYPWGGDKMVKTQGLKTKYWGRTIALSYEISIKDIIPERNGEDKESLKNDLGTYNRTASQWEFADAIKADIATAVVVGVSIDDEDQFLRMADRNRSEQKLISGRVMPNIDAALKNTCKLMDAQDYISGQASEFDRYFRDQLENGTYLVEEYYQEQDEPEVIGDTMIVRAIQPRNATKQKRYRIKRDGQGNILRDNKSNTLAQYGVRIYQAQVTGIDWESSFDERLQLQKEQVAQTQLEKQEAEKEFYRAKKEVAKGESDKAAERARLEKEQIQQTIEAETRAKVAEQDLIAEKKRYEVEQFKAKSKMVEADATYYENSKRVAAGLTPQERAQLEKEIAIGVAEQLKQLTLPSTVITTGGGGGKDQASLLESLIGAELARKMMAGN